MPGVILYEGPSMLDGAPIFVAAVWRSANRKTGDMLQTYIMRSDMPPLEASKTGQDKSICGSCRHRGVPTTDPKRKQAERRSCYVVLGQGPTIVYKSFLRGVYPKQTTPEGRRDVGSCRLVRIGTYGDGAAAPSYVWEELLEDADGHTAYSHNGGDPRRYMTSADSLAEARAAWSRGERTFRVVGNVKEIVPRQEIECPSERGVQCADCRLCGGSAVQASRSPSWRMAVVPSISRRKR